MPKDCSSAMIDLSTSTCFEVVGVGVEEILEKKKEKIGRKGKLSISDVGFVGLERIMSAWRSKAKREFLHHASFFPTTRSHGSRAIHVHTSHFQGSNYSRNHSRRCRCDYCRACKELGRHRREPGPKGEGKEVS